MVSLITNIAQLHANAYDAHVAGFYTNARVIYGNSATRGTTREHLVCLFSRIAITQTKGSKIQKQN